jgi:protein TonB
MKFFKLIGVTAAISLAVAAAPPARERVLRVPSMPESKIVHKVQPVYPPDALDSHIQGVVRIEVTIGKDGRTESVRLLGGHKLLVHSALQAVKGWTYQPTLVDGAPVRVITRVEVPFVLDASGKSAI